MTEPTTAYIDLEALKHNLYKIKEIVPNSNILAMIKRNAYGHGALKIARAINKEVDAFGVMYLKEALQLLDPEIKKPIVVITGFFDVDELKLFDKFGFNCVIHNFMQLEILEKNTANLSKQLSVWLKIDTGMHRLGFKPHQVQDVYQRLMRNKMVKKPLRLMTHFSDADNPNSNKTLEQIICFEKTVANLNGELCMANSAAIFNWPGAHTTWVRPGIALYGISPFKSKNGLELGLKPVMTLSSRIITIHDLDKDEAIGYGSMFKCPEKMRVGTVSIGYGDGYPRNTCGAEVLVDGVRTQIVGRVAMDMLAIDLQKVPNAKIGSTVTLWGKGLSIEKVAACSGESQYELLSRLTSRISYEFSE